MRDSQTLNFRAITMQNRTKYLPIILLLFLIFQGCKTTRIVVIPEAERERALSAQSEGEHQEAINSWEAYFQLMQSSSGTILPADYSTAAISAYHAGNHDLALRWFDQARYADYSNFEMYATMAAIYRSADNLSREIFALNFLNDNFSTLAQQTGVSVRLFEIFSETDPSRAIVLWDDLPYEVKIVETMLDRWFRLNLPGGDKNLLDSVSLQLIEKNPRHKEALEWQAEKYYRMAEEQYQQEMQKYNQNRTHVQYQFLLNSLRDISEVYRRSLRYFEVLWEMDPTPTYAAFISNIYLRFDDRERADYFRRLSEPQR